MEYLVKIPIWIFEFIIDAILFIISIPVKIICWIKDFIIGLFKSDNSIEKAKEETEKSKEGILTRIWNWIKEKVLSVIDFIVGIVNFIIHLPKKILEFIESVPKMLFGETIEIDITDLFGKIWDKIVEKVKQVVSFIWEIFKYIVSIPKRIIEWIIEFFKEIDIIGTAKKILFKAFEWVKGFIGGIIDKIKGFFNWLFGDDKAKSEEVKVPDSATINIKAARVILNLNAEDNQSIHIPLINKAIFTMGQTEVDTFKLSNIALMDFRILGIQEMDDLDLSVNTIDKFIKTETYVDKSGINVPTITQQMGHIYSEFAKGVKEAISGAATIEKEKQEIIAKILTKELIVSELKLSKETIEKLSEVFVTKEKEISQKQISQQTPPAPNRY